MIATFFDQLLPDIIATMREAAEAGGQDLQEGEETCRMRVLGDGACLLVPAQPMAPTQADMSKINVQFRLKCT